MYICDVPLRKQLADASHLCLSTPADVKPRARRSDSKPTQTNKKARRTPAVDAPAADKEDKYPLGELVSLLERNKKFIVESGADKADTLVGEVKAMPDKLLPAERERIASNSKKALAGSSLKAYRPSANKIEFFCKYGHISEPCRRWFAENNEGAQLGPHNVDLSLENEGPVTAVRLLLWAEASFPGYFEAYPNLKKPPALSLSNFQAFYSSMNLIYKLQGIKSGRAGITRPGRIREFADVDITVVGIEKRITARGNM